MQSSPKEASTSRASTHNNRSYPPAQLLTTDVAVNAWPATQGFRAFWEWTKRRCDRIKGKQIMRDSYDGDPSSHRIQALLDMLNAMISWVEEVPLEPASNQRFGNLAFRKYNKIVEGRLPAIVTRFPEIPPGFADQVIPLLINSTAFGQPVRLDYGTGHELAFILFMWCCVASGWIGTGDRGELEEDDLVLGVFPKYLELVTLLQSKYRLEPAGSHGVWGLDDYCFFPYLFGSAQLLDSSTTPSQALTNALNDDIKITDMYTLSLRRIKLFKKGAAFSEHSPMLHSLSTFPNWTKVHGGLRKMFMGEIVGKRVVVQSLWIGSWCGGDELERAVKHQHTADGTHGTAPFSDAVTKAPWAT